MIDGQVVTTLYVVCTTVDAVSLTVHSRCAGMGRDGLRW